MNVKGLMGAHAPQEDTASTQLDHMDALVTQDTIL